MNNVEEFNDNLFFVFEKLLMDKELAEKFAECKTEDELYNFCLKIKGGYTKEEWEKFAEIIYKLTINKENDKILLDNDLEEIGGGSMTNNIGKKALSGTLAALTAATVLQVGSVGASAASSSPKPKTSVSQRSSTNEGGLLKNILIKLGFAVTAIFNGFCLYKLVTFRKDSESSEDLKLSQTQNEVKDKASKSDSKSSEDETSSLDSVIPADTPLNQTSDDEKRKVPTEKSTEDETELRSLNRGEEALAVKCLPNLSLGCYCGAVSMLLYNIKTFRDFVNNYKGENRSVIAFKYIFEVIENGQINEKNLKKSYEVCFGYSDKQGDAADLLKKVKEDIREFEFPEIHRVLTSQAMIGGSEGITRSMEFLIQHGDEESANYDRLVEKAEIDESSLERLREVAKEEFSGSMDKCTEENVNNRMYTMMTRINGIQFKSEWLDPLKIHPVGGRFLINCIRDDHADYRENLMRFNNPFKVELDGKIYYLDDCILHYGTDRSGHYVYLKFNSEKVCWQKFDTKIRTITDLRDEIVGDMIRAYGVIFEYVEKVDR